MAGELRGPEDAPDVGEGKEVGLWEGSEDLWLTKDPRGCLEGVARREEQEEKPGVLGREERVDPPLSSAPAPPPASGRPAAQALNSAWFNYSL